MSNTGRRWLMGGGLAALLLVALAVLWVRGLQLFVTTPLNRTAAVYLLVEDGRTKIRFHRLGRHQFLFQHPHYEGGALIGCDCVSAGEFIGVPLDYITSSPGFVLHRIDFLPSHRVRYSEQALAAYTPGKRWTVELNDRDIVSFGSAIRCIESPFGQEVITNCR